MADDKKPIWASKFQKKEDLDPQKGAQVFDKNLWEAKQIEGQKNVEMRAKENEEKYKQASKLKQKASKTPKGSPTDKTVTPPTKGK